MSEFTCRQVACGGHHTIGLFNKLPPLSNDLSLIINQNEFSDVTLVSLEEKKIYAHRAILSARSPYFLQLFSENSQLDKVSINADHATVMNLLQFIYTDDCTVAKNMAQKDSSLYKLAELYQLPRLQELCDAINEESNSISPPTLSEDIKKTMDNPNFFPDFVFLIEGKKIYCHK